MGKGLKRVSHILTTKSFKYNNLWRFKFDEIFGPTILDLVSFLDEKEEKEFFVESDIPYYAYKDVLLIYPYSMDYCDECKKNHIRWLVTMRHRPIINKPREYIHITITHKRVFCILNFIHSEIGYAIVIHPKCGNPSLYKYIQFSSLRVRERTNWKDLPWKEILLDTVNAFNYLLPYIKPVLRDADYVSPYFYHEVFGKKQYNFYIPFPDEFTTGKILGMALDILRSMKYRILYLEKEKMRVIVEYDEPNILLLVCEYF